MAIFDMFYDNKVKQIDLDKIGRLIDGVVIKLNEYMIDQPEIVLDQSKNKDLLNKEGKIDNNFRVGLASFYCAILKWYCSNKKASDDIVKYVDNNYPILDKTTAKQLWENSQDKSKKAEHAVFHITESIMNLQIATYIKRMDNSTETIPTHKMIDSLGDVVINERFNQKCSEYNSTLLRESVKHVIEMSKGN